MSMGAVSTTAAIAFLEGMKRALDLLAEHDSRWGSNTGPHREAIRHDMMQQKIGFERSIGVPLNMPKGWI